MSIESVFNHRLSQLCYEHISADMGHDTSVWLHAGLGAMVSAAPQKQGFHVQDLMSPGGSGHARADLDVLLSGKSVDFLIYHNPLGLVHPSWWLSEYAPYGAEMTRVVTMHLSSIQLVPVGLVKHQAVLWQDCLSIASLSPDYQACSQAASNHGCQLQYNHAAHLDLVFKNGMADFKQHAQAFCQYQQQAYMSSIYPLKYGPFPSDHPHHLPQGLHGLMGLNWEGLFKQIHQAYPGCSFQQPWLARFTFDHMHFLWEPTQRGTAHGLYQWVNEQGDVQVDIKKLIESRQV